VGHRDELNGTGAVDDTADHVLMSDVEPGVPDEVEGLFAAADAALADVLATGDSAGHWHRMGSFMMTFERFAEAVRAGRARWSDARPWTRRAADRLATAGMALREWENRIIPGGEEGTERALTMRSQRAIAGDLFAGTSAGELLRSADDFEEDEELRRWSEYIPVDAPDWVPPSHTWWRPGSDRRLERPPATEVYDDPAPPAGWRPLTAARWLDLVRLLGDGRRNGNCWCSYPRMRDPSQRHKGRGLPWWDPDSNRARLRRLVHAGEPVGVLLYDHGEPIGWCGVAPRTALAMYDVTFPRVDDTPTWTVGCLYVAGERRGAHTSVALLNAAAEYAASEGAVVIEGYPRPPGYRVTYTSALYGWTGAFTAAGFSATGHTRSEHVVMRRSLSH
jgi:GNAT superfamily N-acetyltransferase